jgi:hypothetical protein
MAIEVRQMTIRSFVAGDGEEERESLSRQETERLREEILTECRRMVLELMHADRER